MSAICRNEALVPFLNTVRSYSQNSLGSAKILKDQDRHIVEFSKNNLKTSYANLYARLAELTFEIKVTAVISPAISMGWLALTTQPLVESPVGMACLLSGGAVITNRLIQMYRIKEYAKLSALINPSSLSDLKEVKQEVKQIIAGSDPKVELALSGMEISGPIQKTNQISSVAKGPLARIHSMERIVIPSCMVSKKASPLIDQTMSRWVSRLSVPFAIFNLLTILNKENRRLDDYVVAASSAHNIYDYANGPSVGKARDDLRNYLAQAKTSKQVLEKIIDPEDLEGSLSFLNEWAKDANSLAIRVGRTGEPILYKNGKSSFGGPFPAKSFPLKR